ncbi:hypothetical protein PGT21_015031 [Puccinia graminis f. sp. tritici]|uniref:Uncharacterized protein n=1 Tax=Puccinia graminis f. sp. tritici TaxID=56615 RepID=A0A5B0PQ21_PUCGR|nr:hypothetical protein PGT21_015031 [Puccinia graminis f. sp. tritici]
MKCISTRCSTATIKPGQLYGTISTPSFVTCNATDPIDYQVLLNTNASVEHTLSTSFVYSLAGRLLLLNTPAPPTLNYYLDTVCKVCTVEHHVDDTPDKTFTTGPGIVISVLKPTSEITNDSQENKKKDLTIIVNHTDWDPADQLVKPFDVKYIIPATPKLANTHSMIRVGREFHFDGYLFGWDMKEHQAIIKVLGFSPLNVANTGSQPKSHAGTPQSSPVNRGRKFDAGHPQSNAEISPDSKSESTGLRQAGSSEGSSGPINETLDSGDPDDAPLALTVPSKGKNKLVEASPPNKKKRGTPGA